MRISPQRLNNRQDGNTLVIAVEFVELVGVAIIGGHHREAQFISQRLARRIASDLARCLRRQNLSAPHPAMEAQG